MKTKKKSSISNRIWFYYFFFIVIVLAIIWLMQNLFIERSYSSLLIREVQKTGDQITRSYREGEDIKYLVRHHSINTTFKIQLVDEKGKITYPEDWLGVFYSNLFETRNYQDLALDFPKRPGQSQTYGLEDQDSQVIYYVSNLGQDSYLLIESALRPIDSTVRIMQAQFPYIAIFTILIGIVVAFFAARRLSKPVEDLNDAAKSISTSNYDIVFPQSSIEELDELAQSLNYATQELAKMDQSRISLLANISHDLKTPLTVIRSYAEMIKDITGDDKKARDQNLDTIMQEADRLTEMVNSILDITKLELDMEELTLSRFSLKDMTEEICKRLEVFVQTNDTKLQIIASSQAIIEADQNKIRQVAYNLISNGITFAGENKLVTIEIIEDQDKITYAVIDQGPGIAQQDQEKVWEKYYTQSDNHARRDVGTGLGLHIAKVVLEEHGFDYGVDSQKGKGSRFYFIVDK